MTFNEVLLNEQIELEMTLDNVRMMSSRMTKSEQLFELIDEFYKKVLYKFSKAEFFMFFERKLAGNFKIWAGKREWKDVIELFKSPNSETFDEIISKYANNECSSFNLNGLEKSRFFNELFNQSKDDPSKVNLENEFTSMEVFGNIWLSKNSGFIFLRQTNLDFNKKEQDINIRLGNVFEQFFTRHLDLKKTERYEKEAEIEEALEIVRARSLAMHHTSELQDLVNVVSQQLIINQININGGVFITINDEVTLEGVPIWGSGGLANYVQKAIVPYIDNPIFLNLRDAIRNRTPFVTELISKEHKVEFFKHLFNHLPWRETDPEIKKQILDKDGGYARSVTISKHTCIFMLNNIGVPFSDFDNETLKRFGKVLEQSYVRFLDLQKVENQAKNLAELEAAKTRLYANITHEFRTPLTVINGMTEQISSNPEKWLSEGVEMINRNSNRLLELVNQLLDLSKLENGKLKLYNQQSDILEFSKYIVKGLDSLAASKSIDIRFESELQNLVMDFDKEKIQVVLVNLVSNAIKFTPNGGLITARISQLSLNEKRHAKILIQDNGLGISEKNLPNIFNRFYQVDDSDTRLEGGSGIGLALVHELIKSMQGNICVKSKLGEGTVFELLLPISNEAQLIVNEEASKKDFNKITPISIEKPIDEKNNENPLLLLIEDNPDVVSYIVSCLNENYEIKVGKNGQEGIEMALEFIPDLIISDVMMPLKDGFEVCSCLKKDQKTSHIPIILLTAKADIDSKLQGLEEGADAYLIKPFHKEELELRIRKLLELREKLQQYYLSQISTPENPSIAGKISENNINENTFFRKIRNIVEDNILNSEFNIEDFCTSIGMSHSQLHRKLIAITGTSPNRFIRKIRLEKACHLLRNRELNISEIAYNTGFNDPGYFSRMFKQEYNVSPLEWRAHLN
ncbi:response regulator [Lacihabitans sp. LS3-19]|uniref:hybrid sensor histidine kinase/response regulator transcription factor n=1 Tax=Lacihabitans sp. LS3-19 TaxID=2487335 RepID=UPI0020CD2C80|nr:ATP-binding protein [Lacihabitans sp. LS3-19]MCP9770496.1 response regulator [Lacihabitans sp. LS3-19]